jgi:thymidylate synthase
MKTGIGNMRFYNAEQAFQKIYNMLNKHGENVGNTKVMYNVGFYLENPMSNEINIESRKWNKEYAEYEWQWYLSGNPDASEISKRAPIWKNHMDENGKVRSNYGWQWLRGSQLDRIIDKLHFSLINKNDREERQAVISIYDGKEIGSYAYDTPCTLTIHFQIIKDKLCMTVNMRSNDIWYGFCNDQYCFSKLQELVSKELNLEMGWYYHFTSNMHLYDNFYNKTI